LAKTMNQGALVTFTWRPEISGYKSVQLAGTFTSWKPVDMLPPPSGSEQSYWTLNRHLEPGEHQYKYVVDGKWIHDDKKDTVENEVGSKNNVIRIEEYPGSEKLSEGLDDEDDRASVSSISDDDEEEEEEDEWEVLDKPISQSSSIEVLDNTAVATGSAKTSVCKKPSLEVERKFVVPGDYKERLRDNGFEPVHQFRENLVDAYFDFASGDFPLLTNDHWLRKRNGDWELKYPVGGGSMASSMDEESYESSQQSTTLYHETSNLEDILCKVRVVSPAAAALMPELSDDDDDDEEVNLNTLVERSVLRPFAQLETKRKCYKRSSDNVNIVVDETDWGYIIGEIEVMVETKEQVCAATQQIEALANQLEFSKMDLVTLGQQVQNSAINL